MDQGTAARAADRFRQLLDGPEREEEVRRTAAFYGAHELIPDEATWTCISVGDPPEPTIIAFAAGQLFLLTVPAPEENARHAAAALRAVPVTPKTGRVEVEVTHKGDTPNPPADATWRFDLDGIALQIEVNRDSEGFASDTGPLVKALTDALGWKLPPELFAPRA
jgi:hypothetical protein